jgi:chemotaxis protein MotB
MRKKKHAEHENHERWLVSYADFITLLFAFFVVMFATNQSDKNRAKLVSDSVRDAIEHGQISSRLSNMLGKGKHEEAAPDHAPVPEAQKPNGAKPADAKAADLAKSLETLRKGLAAELKGGKVQVKLEPRGLVIELREAAFFASGDDKLSPGCYGMLEKIAAVGRGVSNQVRVEGYTDSVPIHNSRFRSNWELSSARAIATLDTLAGRFRIDAARMAVAGYAENAPADTNDTEEGRAHNRRVTIVLLTQDGQKSEPAAAMNATLAQRKGL